MRKFTGTEKYEVLTPDQHKAVEAKLHSMGKVSASTLSEEERREIFEDSLETEK